MKSLFRPLNKKVSHLLFLAAGRVYRFSTLVLVAVGLILSASKNIGSDVPDKRRFTKVVLAENLNEPMEMTFLPTGELIFIERKGAVKMLNSNTGKVFEIGNVAVGTEYTSLTGRKSVAEDGLIGIVADPDFQTNHWLYFFYSPQGDEAKNVIARYELKDSQINQESKRIILEIPTQHQECCHTGGGMVFDAAKNLYISTGDNISPKATVFAPIDERPGKSPFDAQKSSGNTNDLRGKIIRIHPEPDGSYTIPEGNLFSKGTEKTRPEIYTMGHRNPWRLSIDSKTGRFHG